MKAIVFIFAAYAAMAQDKVVAQIDTVEVMVDGGSMACSIYRSDDGALGYLHCIGDYPLIRTSLLGLSEGVGGKSMDGGNLLTGNKRYRVCWFTPPYGRVSCSPLFGFAKAKIMAKGIDRSFIDEAVK
jgi:hypothetical protein